MLDQQTKAKFAKRMKRAHELMDQTLDPKDPKKNQLILELARKHAREKAPGYEKFLGNPKDPGNEEYVAMTLYFLEQAIKEEAQQNPAQ